MGCLTETRKHSSVPVLFLAPHRECRGHAPGKVLHALGEPVGQPPGGPETRKQGAMSLRRT